MVPFQVCPMPALLRRGSHKWSQETNRELNLRRKTQEASSNPEVIKKQQKRSRMHRVRFFSRLPGLYLSHFLTLGKEA